MGAKKKSKAGKGDGERSGESLSTGQYSLHVAVGPLPIGAAVRVSGAGAFEGARRVSAKVWRWVYAYVHRKQ